MQYNLHRQVDQSIILADFTALLDALPDEEVWAHHHRGRRGTDPRLVLKLLAVRFLFGLSSARTLGIAELLRGALNIDARTQFPSDSTLDYRLRSGVLDELLERLLALSVATLEENCVAMDSTGFEDTRGHAQVWCTNGKKQPRGWRKAHLIVGTRSHRVYALRITAGKDGDAPQAKALLSACRDRNAAPSQAVGDMSYASREIATHAENLGLQPTMHLRDHWKPRSHGHPAWKRMINRARRKPEAYAKTYHQRSNVESVNSSWKHRFGSRLAMRTARAQDTEVRFKAVLHNLAQPNAF